MSHLVLQAHKLTLKVFNLHLQVFHGGFSVLNYAFELIVLELELFKFVLQIAIHFDLTFFFVIESSARLLSVNYLLLFVL